MLLFDPAEANNADGDDDDDEDTTARGSRTHDRTTLILIL